MKTTKTSRSTPYCKRTARQILSTAFAAAIFMAAMISPAYAETVQSSSFYTGFIALLNDLMTAAMVICPVVGGLAAVVFLIRRSMADEQDGKMWNKKIYTSIICGVAGCLVTGIIALITSYVN